MRKASFMNNTTEAFIVSNEIESTECMPCFQLLFTHNKHGAMHLAVNAKVIEIVIL